MDLNFVYIYEPCNLNEERIIAIAMDDCNLKDYYVEGSNGTKYPLTNVNAFKGDIVLIYTTTRTNITFKTKNGWTFHELYLNLNKPLWCDTPYTTSTHGSPIKKV